MKKIIHCSAGAFLLAAGAVAAVMLLLPVFGVRPRIVLSGSMEPAVHTGSLCFIDAGYPYRDIREGDIIAFRAGGMEAMHRVVDIDGEGMMTKGDSNDGPDGGRVTSDRYLGKNILSIPFAGYLVSWMKTVPGILVSVLSFLLLYQVFRFTL